MFSLDNDINNVPRQQGKFWCEDPRSALARGGGERLGRGGGREKEEKTERVC